MDQGNHPSTPSDLLIIHPGALGDVVAMFVLIARLRKRYGRTTLVGQASIGRLATALDLVDRCCSQETALWASLYTRQPDQRALRLLAAHRRIILFAVGGELEKIINAHAAVRCLRVAPRPPAQSRVHVTRFAAKALLANGLIDRIPSLRTAICRPPDPLVPGSSESKLPPVLLHPGAGSPRKRWPISGFLAVAQKILSAGGHPELIIGPAEKDLLAAPLPPGLPVHVLSEISELLRLLKSAAGFIGNDSGVAHLAACLGLPTTVIFTVSDPLRWRPNGPAVATLAPALPCQPCFETRTANCAQPDCLQAVTPEKVWLAFRQLHKNHRPPAERVV